MNDVNARAVPAMGGFVGQIRKVNRADYETVCRDGKPILFSCRKDAEIAAWRTLREHLIHDIVGSGERIALAARTKAEELFGAIVKDGRKIEVVRR